MMMIAGRWSMVMVVTVGQGNVKGMYVLHKISPTMTDANHDLLNYTTQGMYKSAVSFSLCRYPIIISVSITITK